MTFSTAIDIFDIIRSSLKVAGCVVALRDEDIVIDTALQRLVQRNGWALFSVSFVRESKERMLTMNFSSILPSRSKPGASSRWWFAVVSAMVETIAM